MKLCSECKWSTNLGDTVRHPEPQWACANEEVGSYIDVVDGSRVYMACHNEYTQDELAKKFKMGQTTISRIIRNGHWLCH